MTKKLLNSHIFSSLNKKLSKAFKEIALEDERIIELKANMKAINENTDKILSKSKQLELHMNKIQCDSISKIDELNRLVISSLLIRLHQSELHFNNKFNNCVIFIFYTKFN